MLVTCYSLQHNAALDVFPSLKTEDKAEGKHDYSPVTQSMEYSIWGGQRDYLMTGRIIHLFRFPCFFFLSLD